MKTILCFLAAVAFCATIVTGVGFAAADDPHSHSFASVPALEGVEYPPQSADVAEHPYRPLFSETLVAQADLGSGTDAGAPLISDAGPEAGSGSSTTPAPTPADKLHNAVDDPIAAVSDARALYKQGWAIFLLGLVVMTTATFARAADKWKTVKLFVWFAKHKTVILVVSGVGAVGAAAFNALALGGTWFAAAYAALGAAFTLVAPSGTTK